MQRKRRDAYVAASLNWHGILLANLTDAVLRTTESEDAAYGIGALAERTKKKVYGVSLSIPAYGFQMQGAERRRQKMFLRRASAL